MESYLSFRSAKKNLVIAANVSADADRFQCATCTWGRHCDASNPAPFKQWVIDRVIESDICLLPMITSMSNQYLRMHRHYSNGFLAQAGGVCDQPNLYLEAMELLDSTFNKIESDKLRRETARHDNH